MEQVAYKDRKGLIVTAGVFQILLGIGCLAMAALQVLAVLMTSTQVQSQRMMLIGAVMGMVFYIGLGVVNIWLAVGAIMVRKWARALNLVFGWLWLICLAVVLVIMPFVMGRMSASNPNISDSTIVIIVVMIVMAVLLLVPLFFVLVYSGKNVRATFESRDPQPRWTDQCPLTVLAAAVIIFSYALSCVQLIFMGPVFFLFGDVVTGWVAAVLNLVLFGIYMAVVVGLYRLKQRAWIAGSVVIVLHMVSNAVTALNGGMRTYYEILGYSERMLKQVDAMGFANGTGMAVAMGVSVVCVLGYMFWIRKHFVKKPSDVEGPVTTE